MDFRRNNLKGGFTLIEVMISLAVASMIAVGLAGLSFFLSRSSSVIVNYAAINAKDRVSLEILARDIRGAESFTTLTPSNIVMVVAGQAVTFTFNEQEGRLYRTVGSTNQVLLPNCSSLSFEFRERNPLAAGFENHLVSTSATCRIIQMTWSSSILTDPKGGQSSMVLNTAKYLNRRPL